MTEVRIDWRSRVGTLARLVAREMHAASKQVPCWFVLGFGLGNLLLAMAFGVGDWLPTFAVLDLVYTNFAYASWFVVAYLGAQKPVAPSGWGLVAKTAANAIVGGVMLTAAGIAAVIGQLWHGTIPDVPLLVAGIYANLGWSTLHLAMLAVAVRAILGHRWLSVATTVVLWTGSNLAFEHPLLRIGASISPASGMNGFGPFLVPQVAGGIYWTGFCIVLLVLGRLIAARRSVRPDGSASHTLTPNTFAIVWTAAVACVVTGAWIAVQAAHADRPTNEASGTQAFCEPAQPVYSRLDLDISISPLERVLVSRGTAIVVNRHDEPIPDLYFDAPLELVSLDLTGDYVGPADATRRHRYRLNRPLEPRETLKIEFELRWLANDFETGPRNTRLVENGTYVRTSDVVPALGNARDGDPFAAAPPVAFRARIGTSLDQVAVTAGTLVRAWKENGWSFFEYESREPIPPLTTIHSGHYAVQRRRVEEGIIEVFHHPPHRANVRHMIDAGRAALTHRSTSTSATDPVVKVVEVPGYRAFRRLGFAWLGHTQAPPETPRGLVLPYSERGYLISTPRRSESTPRRPSDRRHC